MKARQASISRKTTETNVEVKVNLDGTGNYDVVTGIGFLDHMLEQFSKHSMIDLIVSAKGDLHIDHHHTTEDVGIALGQSLKKALGDMKGITRFADSHLAMDESLTRSVLDVSGRPCLVWLVEFPTTKVGDFDTELIREFFQAVAMNSGITLHISNLYGSNSHHIAETCFKSFGLSLRKAIEIDQRRGKNIPSTKGKIGN